MQFRGDDRGQSIQVGAILLFGILIIALATMQATVVPDQNAGVEFRHSQTVQSDMQDLRNGLVRAATGDASPTRVSLGTTYPNRFLFINPPPATGNLRTVDAGNSSMTVTIGNSSGSVTVDAADGYENAREYWASDPRAGEYNTSEIVYEPDYAEYDGAPTTVYGSSVLYNTFDNDANRTLTGQRLIQGNTIDLLAIRGDLSETSAGSETVDTTTVSERARTVTVESEPNDPLYVNVTSRLSASVWEDDLLAGQSVNEVREVGDLDDPYHRISIELEPGSYRLRAGAVGVGTLTNETSTTDPAYMVVTDGYETVSTGGDSGGSLIVEVRDRFNNPVTGEIVNASADGQFLKVVTDDGVPVNETTFETDADGQAEIDYRAVNATSGDAWLNVSLQDASASYEREVFEDLAVTEFDLGDDGDDGELNPGTTGDLIQVNESVDGDTVELEFNNTIGSQTNITSIRLNFYHYSQNQGAPTEADVAVGETTRAADVGIGGQYRSLNPKIEVGPNATGTTFSLVFDSDPSAQGSNRDFFVMSLVFDVDGTQYRETYFVGL